MDLIRFDRADHHPVTFAFVADRNFPDFDFHRAVCKDRQTSASVFGRNARIAAIRGWLAKRRQNTLCYTLGRSRTEGCASRGQSSRSLVSSPRGGAHRKSLASARRLAAARNPSRILACTLATTRAYYRLAPDRL